MGFVKIADRKIVDVTKQNLSQVPRSRGGNAIKFIVVHYMGVPNAQSYWLYGGGYGGHYNIFFDGTIYKSADPRTAILWHCGGGLQGSGGHSFYQICTNSNSIGIECACKYTEQVKDASGDSGKWYFTTETQESIIYLVSKLMDEYGIGIDHVIRHYDVTGKICPNPYVKNNNLKTSWTWDQFKARLAEYRRSGGYTTGSSAPTTPSEETKYYRVRKAWADASSQLGAYAILDNAKASCPAGYAVFDWNGKEVYRPKEKAEETATSGLQAASLKGLSEADVVKKVGPLFTKDMEKSGILASVTAAQFILESGYGKTELAQGANNCFGMKKSLSGNTWAGTTWDGKSVYTKKTQEDDGKGNLYTITADFRKYPCVEDSIGDHSAYLLGAKNGSKLRYAGLQGEGSYKKAIQIIKDGGYATDTKYVAKICEIIERWKLTDLDKAAKITPSDPEPAPAEQTLYRVRKTWEDAASQKGAYHILENAKACADQNPGYCVFDEDGKSIYESKSAAVPFLARVDIDDLNIRTGPGTNYSRTQYIPKGVYTIVEVKSGKGSTAGWGRLKSGAGWISLDFAVKLK